MFFLKMLFNNKIRIPIKKINVYDNMGGLLMIYVSHESCFELGSTGRRSVQVGGHC